MRSGDHHRVIRQADTVAAVAMDAFARRLNPKNPRPLAVALSGGGDSVALLLLADCWAKAHGRRIIVLTVDHRLQAGSGAWTDACARLAARLGADFRALAWEGEKPRTGLPAAARAARHALLAKAARDAGARVLLMGHTADDVLEARAMRAAGSTTPEPRSWSPSPTWPEGRGLFLLRPLLAIRRPALRQWLAAQGEAWLEDPANQDPRFARARARAALTQASEVALAEEPPLLLAKRSRCDANGVITLEGLTLREAGPEAASRWLGLAAVCAGGGARLPAAAARDRLAGRLCGDGPVLATLAGARVTADPAQVRLVRESGEARRGGLQGLELSGTVVWDGRFEATPLVEGLQVRRLGGIARRLPLDQRRALAALPADVRPGLPAIVEASGAVSCPLLGASPARVKCLVGERLTAAAGLVTCEPD